MIYFLLNLVVLVLFINSDELYPSECTGLEDGTYNLKLVEGDEYPVITAKCSNEHIIIDYNLDNNIASYFTSFDQWFVTVGGPDNSESINWKDWFIPSSLVHDDDKISWYLSPNCDVCDPDSNFNSVYGNVSTYWMTATLYGCFWPIKGQHNCDVSYDTFSCYSCSGTRTEITEDTVSSLGRGRIKQTGICPTTFRSAYHETPNSHDECQDATWGENLKPSLGINGKNCVCFKQVENSPTEYSGTITEDDNDNDDSDDDDDEEEASTDDIYELYQSDFRYGTYRIQKSGTYKIMENIKFNFNAPPQSGMISNNENLQEYWVPLESQADDYPGAGGYHDTYFMGFFAGITVEADDVVIDLNGKTIAMDEPFYHQQRWFTIIELSKQYFFPGQGIGNFGPNPHFSQNVIVKDGVLGLTSHHGIHGNYNKDILIQNVVVKDFETHGIQFNGFNNIELKNIEIGPTTRKAKLNGEYGHWRFLLPRIKNIAEETSDETIQFYGRDESTTMQDIADEIELKMNYAFNYIAFGKEYSENDSEYNDFKDALELFINFDGMPYASAQYGIFLNTFGASVFTYNLFNSFYSDTALLENIKIHDLEHKMVEYVRFWTTGSGNIYINPFNAPLDAKNMVDDIENLDLNALRNGEINYSGNILTDAYIAMNKLTDNWNYLQLQIVLNDELTAWALDGDATGIKFISLGCNSDVMLHSGKGTQALRLDGVSNVIVNNLEIYNIYDYTELGVNTCDNYKDLDSFKDDKGGHFRQTLPMQDGFSGYMNQGININAAIDITLEDIYIHNLYSDYGPVFGISIWPSCTVELKGDFVFHDFYAGSNLELNTFSYFDRPNKAPEVCGLRVYNEYSQYNTTVTASNDEINNIISCGFSGHVGCMGLDNDDSLSTVDNDNINTISISSKTKHTGVFIQQTMYSMGGSYISSSNCKHNSIISKISKSKFSSSLHLEMFTNNKSKHNIKTSDINGLYIAVSFGFILMFIVLCGLYKHCKSSNEIKDYKYQLLDPKLIRTPNNKSFNSNINYGSVN